MWMIYPECLHSLYTLLLIFGANADVDLKPYTDGYREVLILRY